MAVERLANEEIPLRWQPSGSRWKKSKREWSRAACGARKSERDGGRAARWEGNPIAFALNRRALRANRLPPEDFGTLSAVPRAASTESARYAT
jgi:hypothetical protein